MPEAMKSRAGPIIFNVKLLSMGKSMHTAQSTTLGGGSKDNWDLFHHEVSGCETLCASHQLPKDTNSCLLCTQLGTIFNIFHSLQAAQL